MGRLAEEAAKRRAMSGKPDVPEGRPFPWKGFGCAMGCALVLMAVAGVLGAAAVLLVMNPELLGG